MAHTDSSPAIPQQPGTEQPGDWPAPTAVGPVRAVVPVPGSKSATNRALVLAALASERSVLRSALDARDTRLMVDALAALGVALEVAAPDAVGNVDITVTPGPLTGPARIDVGLAGTVMRFVPPVAALASGPVAFDGDEQARHRPMTTTIHALRALGVTVTGDGLPFTVEATGHVAGGRLTIDASSSSQFVSALLLAGARFDEGLALTHAGPPVPSAPHIEMTVAMLRERGVHVQADGTSWHVLPGPIAGIDAVIEPDLSNAAPFLAAAMATRGSVTIPHWPTTTTQPGDALRDLLARMGASIELRTDAHGITSLTVAMDGPIHGIDADLGEVGELTPTLAALAALAHEPSRLRGIAHLRGHETDRLAALATELSRIGCRAEETPDGLVIEPGDLRPARFRTYADHRMATAGAIIGLVVPGVIVEDVATTEKTIPDFPGRWGRMLAA